MMRFGASSPICAAPVFVAATAQTVGVTIVTA